MINAVAYHVTFRIFGHIIIKRQINIVCFKLFIVIKEILNIYFIEKILINGYYCTISFKKVEFANTQF